MHIKEKINMTSKKLDKLCYKRIFEIEGLEMQECGYKKSNTPPDGNWGRFGVMHGAHKHYWIRGKFLTPPAKEGVRYMLRALTGIKEWDAINPQGMVYLNGKMVQGLDVNHTEVYLEPDTDYDLAIYYYLHDITAPVFMDIHIAERYTDVYGLYYDILTPYDALSVLNENTQEYVTIQTHLEMACNLIDFRAPYSDAFFDSVKAARGYLESEFYSKCCSTEGKPVVHCIGHTHIDVEWEWARKQTREKIQRSFSNLKALMDNYPEYKFTLSQPELYRYLKEEAPEKYEELKELVREGRFEPEGGMWVECDCNLSSGESFVRQFLHGKKFFKDEFDADSKVLFLPDVFGYSAALPQILKKSGIDYFVTSKISWNDTNMLPVDSFMWQGIDGTEIYSTFITAQKAQPEHKMKRHTTYVGRVDTPLVLGTWDRYQQKEYNTNTLLTFGYGDGGGGPTADMLEKLKRLSRGIPGIPVTKINFLLPMLKTAESEFMKNAGKLGRMPKWVGELYLEFHRGTYTSVAKNKRFNRKSEFALAKAEALSYTDMLLLGGEYDKENLYEMWRKVLHNQFHDILPGSSIHEVYEGTDKDYAQIFDFTDTTCADKINSVINNVKTDGGIFVYNPLGFEEAPIVKLDGKTVEITEKIPAFGWKVVKNCIDSTTVKVKDLTVENDFYRVTLDESGAIVSLFDKSAGREAVKQGEKANRFVVYEDIPYQYDNWELSDYHVSKPYPLDESAKITPIYDGSRAGFRVEKTYLDSTVCQDIWLYTNSRRIDFETKADWQEKQQVLKVYFPIDVLADKATYEIQYGHISRPTHKNTSWDEARFEVCAHKWVDISENGYGVSLLNDCKYGFSAEGSTLSLTALKSGIFPDPLADVGEHHFTYSLMTHSGTLYDAGVIKESYLLNQSAAAVAVGKTDGKLDESFSLVSCDDESVVIETVKRAEADNSMIVRMYESFGARKTVTVSAPFTKCALCDLMENEICELEVTDGKVTLPIKNFEIITLRLKGQIRTSL